MAHAGFILHPTYRLRSGRAVVQLFGRLASGEAFLVEDDRYRPYFFTHPDATRLLAGERDVEVEETELLDVAGAPVVRVIAPVPGAVPRLREKLEAGGARALEADIRFPYRFLIDRGLRAAIAITGEPEPGGDAALLRFRNPELVPGSARPELRVLALDLETTPDASRILSAALVGAGADEVHIASARPVRGAQAHADEASLLQAVAARIRALDPDVLTGWNVVEFDFAVLAARALALGVPFEIGRAPGAIALAQDGSFTRQRRAEIPGRMVLDGIALVRDAFIALDDFSLETAARTLLGRGKRIAHAGRGGRAQEILRMYRDEPEAFVAYNREDAVLVQEILARESLLELAIERSLLCGMQLDRVGASIASFDLLYLPELRRRGRVAPSVNRDRVEGRVSGGAVMDSHPGLFRNVAVFDFKSLYPSLMRTFNLDPLAHACANGDAIEAPNGARFSRSEAILPEILGRFAARRESAKRRGDRHADLAIKIMMNALIGVLGAPSSRFFDPEIANATTSFGRLMLERTRRAFEACGARVLYGDTDSVFVLLDEDASLERAHAFAEELRTRVQADLSAQIRREWRVEPKLELELEHVYERFFQPSVRGGTQGSRKRYAGLVNGNLQVVGLEAVRRDWPEVSRRLQRGMLERLFRDEPVGDFVREVVADLLAGRLDRELVIRKGLRKGAVERYTASTPAHVEAARRSALPVGRTVHYVMTRGGPVAVEPDGELPGDLDRAHYVLKVVEPIAESILVQLGQSFAEVIDAPRQLTLL